jgi:hypothetical protein
VTLRELLDSLAELMLAQGGDLEVLSENGLEIHSVEFNDDEEPCVLILFQETISE